MTQGLSSEWSMSCGGEVVTIHSKGVLGKTAAAGQS
jgi:hypothetical protein